MNDDRRSWSDLGNPPETLEGMVLKLAGRVQVLTELVEKRPMPVVTTPVDHKDRKLPRAKTPEELEELAQWVDRLQQVYAAAGDWLRPCWWRHGLVVGELAALRTCWLGVYDWQDSIESSAALDWHEAAEKCRERIRQAFNTGPGCTAVTHKPDQSVTDDPRWAEERAVLRSKATLVFEPTSSGTATEGSREPEDIRTNPTP